MFKYVVINFLACLGLTEDFLQICEVTATEVNMSILIVFSDILFNFTENSAWRPHAFKSKGAEFRF